MLDRITGLQVFQRVARSGGFSAAARELGMSQTMATKHVAAIEARLGLRLFARTTRRLTLTEAGRDYLSAAERLLADFAEAEASAAAGRARPQGVLRLNVPVSFGLAEIAPALPEFLAAHPDLSVELGLADRVVDLVEEGWDMAVRIGQLRDSTLTARRLAGAAMVVCAAPAYLARRGTPQRTADLPGHDCLGYTLPTPADARRWRFGADGAFVQPIVPRLTANNGGALAAAAAAGQGVVCLPLFMVADALARGALTALELDQPTPALDGIFAVTPPGRMAPAKTRAMIDFLAARWSAPAPWERRLGVAPR